MSKKITRMAALGVAALVASGVVGMAFAAQAQDAATRPSTGSSTSSDADGGQQGNKPSVEREAGIVLEGTGEIRGTTFMVTVYENSRYGNSVQVVLGDPDDDLIGYVEQSEPFVVDGVLNATVRVQGRVVSLSGSVVPTGRPEKVVDSLQDAGQRIVTKGSHRALATDVTLTYRGEEAAVEFAPAFAYDLQVRKIDLYGRGR